MTDDKKKIKSVGRSSGVSKTEAVDDVSGVERTGKVRGVERVKGAGGVSNVQKITAADREKLMAIVTEETNRLAKSGAIPASQRGVIEKAVKMVLESSLLEEASGKK